MHGHRRLVLTAGARVARVRSILPQLYSSVRQDRPYHLACRHSRIVPHCSHMSSALYRYRHGLHADAAPSRASPNCPRARGRPTKRCSGRLGFGRLRLPLPPAAERRYVGRTIGLPPPDQDSPMIDRATFEFDDPFWRAELRLPEWVGFQSRRGAYASQDAEAPSIGLVSLTLGRGTLTPDPPSDLEIQTVQRFTELSSAMQPVLLEAILVEYIQLRPRYRRFLREQADFLMPELRQPSELRALIGLSSVIVSPSHRDDLPVVGFMFGCTWDEEHGLGSLMHGTAVLGVGGPEEALRGLD